MSLGLGEHAANGDWPFTRWIALEVLKQKSRGTGKLRILQVFTFCLQ